MPPRYFTSKPEAVHVYLDGREVCNLDTAEGKREYYRRTRNMSQRQDERCAICLCFLIEPTFDHECGRGAGKQDDRILVDGEWKNAALCWNCNGWKGSRHYRWINGVYAPIEKEN